jgi:Z1 domain
MTNTNKKNKWTPIPGEQANGVVVRAKNLDDSAKAKLITSAVSILGAGIKPDHVGASTGLVVGYVQSGKTLSFTTVIGLARDNGFPLIIVIAGNKDNLLTQSHDRLAKDLDVDGGVGLPAWIMEKNVRVQNNQYEQLIRQTIADWRDLTRDADEKPTLLLTVLKQNHRLSSLTALLKTIGMAGVPALIVDDEADQASLNTKVNQGQESTTYTRIRELREALPSHTFLQYTATPQAPLLINIADTISPDFVHVLEPGDGYVGGEEFFKPQSPYVKIIPATDIPPNNALPVDPPSSLLEALRIFFVGLSASILRGTGRRSMLIHPARERFVHQESVKWVSAAKEEWSQALNLPLNDPDRVDLIADFRKAYDELSKTDKQLPSFDLICDKLLRSLRNTMIIEFNTRGSPKTPVIKWRNAQGWILVGGQAVDRGFTVDSLTVTYMPRGTGVGNADTLQQRARFFGYKRKDLGICRIYLELGIKQAFEEYVEHEQFMRAELKRIEEAGDNLRSWRRRLVLDPSLHPCRRSVVSDRYTRARSGSGWTQQRGALMTLDARQLNTELLDALVAKFSFVPDTTYVSNEIAQKHLVADTVPLQDVVEALVGYRLQDPRDTANFTGLLVTFGEALRRDPHITASIFQMRPGAVSSRTIDVNDGSIENFQQGRTNLVGGGVAYPGDAVFRSPDKVSIQLHRSNLTAVKDGPVIAHAAPLLAIHVPPVLAKDWLVQVQQGQ